MIERTVHTAAIMYFIQSGIPTFSAAVAAIVLVLSMAREAHANSVAKIPRPASNTSNPGPGAKRKTVPMIVTNPPMTPMNTRQMSDPYAVLLICWRIFIAQVYPKPTR